MTLLTGSIWAKISWGHWWMWSSNQLVLFLVLFLFYSAYFMLRFSVEAGPMRANLCAVYALFGVVLIPISFLAIRLANDFIHPTVFTSAGPQMAGSQFATFCVCLAAMLALFATSSTGSSSPASGSTQAARAAGAALVMSPSEKYVAAAYLVVFVFVLAYVLIIGAKLARLEREVGELTELAKRKLDG